ncbi:alpha/beta hydrolase [Coccidioides immitis RS]|uniref:Alpha/beta hydrolase n=3 Tax=Coccidioides immitis TaxID=5501 RepID=A0A0E1RWV4_COCIM|nr:alpha/beta hydrolase [Coccidioides immitis RS]EAS32885.2 alpha/beta hydrolase [Coccidioides immitis RS]KMP08158.1 alpha/beta hydrolase fold [Coccidioides immitis RMSCC 2394]KMU79562.1 alpha/beta hydrolase [Coccidioides immitis RMSCC 3703]TPX19865.1 hypothetical protein DIZ76_017658 [Coccidioides immitis]
MSILGYLGLFLVLAYGVFTFILYGITAICKGTFFHRQTEKENLELVLARDRFWNLSKPWAGLFHRFLTLRTGFKFHYITSDEPGTAGRQKSDKPLVIFLHGFPDSWAIWRHVLASFSIRESSTVVAVDLPGYGGSDSLKKYGATEVLEALTEFIISLREECGVDSPDNEHRSRKVFIVAHDWGGLLAFRLAAEAPQVADRFIIVNGPLMALVRSNVRLLTESSSKMFKMFLREPWHSRSLLLKSVQTLKPVIHQFWCSGYIFAFQLPMPLVRYMGTGGNYSFLKAIHRLSVGVAGKFTLRDAQESMASTLGPGVLECESMTNEGEKYPPSVLERDKSGNFGAIVSYYRHGAADGVWHKSLETISSVFNIWPDGPRRTSSGTGMFDITNGSLKANATVLWGQSDVALDSHLALEGIADYLVHGSQVIVLPRTGHFPQVEVESRVALEKVIEWAVRGEKGDLETFVRSKYPDAKAVVRK